jgi:excisionase family DNA binding protein
MSELLMWPTQAEAAQILQTSTKTIERHGKEGRIEIRKRACPGRRPENVCNPDDIEKLKPLPHIPRPVTIPERYEIVNRQLAKARQANDQAVEPVAMVPHQLSQLFETIATTVQTIQTEAAQTRNASEKLVFTLKEASRLGFSVRYLRRAVDEGRLRSFRDGRSIKIARVSLAEFAREQGASL